MARESLDRAFHHIQDEVLLLGSLVEQATLDAATALRTRDKQLARRVSRSDHFINEKRFAIENAVLILMATQQPMAHDLRRLAAVLEVITELERMGDYAKGNAKVALRLADDESIDIPGREFSQMADLGVGMLHRALSAFISEDEQAARSIPAEDNLVDEIYNRVYHEIVHAMIAAPSKIDHANLLMWIAHNLERFADRVTNICERTIFIATGELFELDSADDEEEDDDQD